MARLLDRIASEGVALPVWCQKKNADPRWVSMLLRAPAIVIDNVARYHYEVDGRDDFNIETDFPNIAPPFKEFWMEARVSGRINRRGALVKESAPEEIGWHFGVVQCPDGWLTACSLVVRYDHAGPPVFMGTLFIGADKSGAFCNSIVEKRFPGPPVGMLRANAPEIQNAPPGFGEVIVHSMTLAIQSFLLAISFMHCKNVTRSAVTPPPALSKKWERKTGKPLVRYHTINIDPMREVLNREGAVQTNGIAKALHICRGHFATYTPEKPLFGRVTGTFWKSQHVRGSAQNGVVVSDYRVHPPVKP